MPPTVLAPTTTRTAETQPKSDGRHSRHSTRIVRSVKQSRIYKTRKQISFARICGLPVKHDVVGKSKARATQTEPRQSMSVAGLVRIHRPASNSGSGA
ncbi:hypothetical protein Ddye_011459 [Dipteronia dyeriana]|uniref:Uncharacterized protein n=1 Tax=Dipteronia dyeriana TaxID=168575 RepID=A0AAD9X2L0_9ROSI|nr:hypothetical protein Ddye_011459 [Dipteronia dyeriana]